MLGSRIAGYRRNTVKHNLIHSLAVTSVSNCPTSFFGSKRSVKAEICSVAVTTPCLIDNVSKTCYIIYFCNVNTGSNVDVTCFHSIDDLSRLTNNLEVNCLDFCGLAPVIFISGSCNMAVYNVVCNNVRTGTDCCVGHYFGVIRIAIIDKHLKHIRFLCYVITCVPNVECVIVNNFCFLKVDSLNIQIEAGVICTKLHCKKNVFCCEVIAIGELNALADLKCVLNLTDGFVAFSKDPDSFTCRVVVPQRLIESVCYANK